jgi:hypothetical protein
LGSSYTQKVTLTSVADVSDKQSAWERSGKFEGDIMLSDERMRNGVINRARHWRAKTVPFVIDRVFSEYCSSKIQSGLQGVKGIFHPL